MPGVYLRKRSLSFNRLIRHVSFRLTGPYPVMLTLFAFNVTISSGRWGRIRDSNREAIGGVSQIIRPQFRASGMRRWRPCPMFTSAADQVLGGVVVDSARERSWVHSRGVRRWEITRAKWLVYSGRGEVAKLMRVEVQVGGEGVVRKLRGSTVGVEDIVSLVELFRIVVVDDDVGVSGFGGEPGIAAVLICDG